MRLGSAREARFIRYAGPYPFLRCSQRRCPYDVLCHSAAQCGSYYQTVVAVLETKRQHRCTRFNSTRHQDTSITPTASSKIKQKQPGDNGGVDVLLFGSQGSHSHFHMDTLTDMERTVPAAAQEAHDFVAACFRAFRDELANISDEDRTELGPWTYEHLDKPRTLLNPPAPCQLDPAIESISLYMPQVLDLLRYRHLAGRRPAAEAVGVCSRRPMQPSAYAAV